MINFDKNFRRFPRKRILKGSISYIMSVLNDFKILSSDGLLFKYVDSLDNKYTPYIFTKSNKHLLFLRKRNYNFYLVGSSNSLSTPENCHIFELVEIPSGYVLFQYKIFNKIYTTHISHTHHSKFY